MADEVRLAVAEGQRVIAEGAVKTEGERFSVDPESAESLLERGLAKRLAGRPPSKAASKTAESPPEPIPDAA